MRPLLRLLTPGLIPASTTGEVADQEAGLQREFPHLEDAQIDQVLARLESWLHQAFEDAQRQHPGKHIRLTWEP
jgi:hypothetical protein